jgi:hypothetical protein
MVMSPDIDLIIVVCIPKQGGGEICQDSMGQDQEEWGR